MLGTQTTGRGRIRVISLYAALGLLTTVLVVWAGAGLSKKIIAERQAELVAELRNNVADSPAFLVERLFDMQESSIPLFLPGMPNAVCFSSGLYSFDPKTFPDSFLNGLVYEPDHGSPVYHLRLREVRATREIEVLDANGKVFYVFKPRPDYDPLWLAKRKHPEIFTVDCVPSQRAFILECMEPSHVEMTIDLIPDSYVDVYAEDSVASLWDALLAQDPVKGSAATSPTLTKAPVPGGMMTAMMRSPAADSNILVTAIGQVSTGMLLQVDYPDTQTNRLEMMVCTNLVEWRWWLVETNLVTVGTNSLMWVDTGATNGAGIANRFYRVGDSADFDGDGLANGREALIYHTDPFALDSDGDGLVDGYSGVVTTNAYPGGVATNGSLYVEGELSWGTDPAKFDTDGDGMGDGWEVKYGHNPLDPNDPPNISGTLFYSGRQTGTVWVVAVTDSNSWSTSHSYTSTTSGFPVSYLIPDLEQTNYWIKSWVDSNGNGQTNATEAQGALTNILTIITNRVTGQDITLADPDNDIDGLPDWWEIFYFGSTTNILGSADPDGDEYTNQEEYDAGTDPTNNLSHPWNLSGTITYTGPQTGTIYVVACTNGTDWAWVHSCILTNLGAYTITHLPPNTEYWVRAWRDSNGDGLPTFWEAWGSHNSNPIFLDANLTGQDVSLADPDNDGDGLLDWWEVLYGLDPTRGGEDGAVAWWKLDEGSGTNVLDETANANNGVLENGSSEWVSGIISNALSLNGTNAYVEVPDSSSLKPDAVSVGMWITPSRLYTNGTAMFLSKRVPGGSAGYSLGYENGKVVFTFCSSGAKSLGYSCALTAGVPVHVAGSFGGTLQTLFINGVQVVSTNYDWGSGFGTISQDTNVLRLGSASGANPTNFFAGTMDDVRVFPGGWTTNDVRAIWELGADPDQDGLGNTEEYKHGTNPTNSDSDADGMLDGVEVKNGLNPLVADAMTDKDGDGYLNIYEIKRGSDPSSSNSIPVPTHIVTNGVSTIQAMINSVTQDYAVVQVKVGIYTNTGNRDIDFSGKKLMLVSESGASNTIIDCQNAGRGFAFHSAETILSVVRGFTIRNGKADWGAGIRCEPGSPTITDCVIAGNIPPDSVGTYGGCGLCVKGGSPWISSTTFLTNGVIGAGIAGGAVLVSGGATLTNCTFFGNKGGDGGAIKAAPTGTAVVVVADCTMVSNSAYYGGGLWVSNGVTVSGCAIRSNSVYVYGGGILCAGSARVGTSVVANNSASHGAGMHFMNVTGTNSPVLSGCEIRDNRTIPGGFGGGIRYDTNCQPPLVLSNTIITGNASDGGMGGGLFILGGGLVMSGGGIASNTALTYAGGIVALSGAVPVVMTNVAIVGNVAQGSSTCVGGLYLGCASSIQLTGLVVSNNSVTASNGVGGIWVSGLGVVMDQCEVVGNRGRGPGNAGGAYVTVNASPGTASVTRCHISGNKSDEAGGLSVSNHWGWVMVRRCVVEGNESTGYWGGLFAHSGGNGTIIENTAILNNRAGIYAGAGFSYAGYLQNCVIAGNTCDISVLPGGFVGRGTPNCVTVRNGVAWGNSGDQLASGINAIYSCVQGGYTNNASSNIITNDPRLLGGYRLLSPQSPCIGAGTNAGLPATDINGDPWANPATPDIGCDGFQFVDSNANSINDDWEQFYFGSLTNSGTGDRDNDGLTDAQEYTDGTVPMERDTDHDGLTDGFEVPRGLDPVGSNDAGGDWNGSGTANSNKFQCGSLAVRVTMADPDRNDDTWNLILNNSVVASCNAGNTWYDSKVVYVERGTTVRFMLQRPETGQGGGTDEYQVNFEAADWPSNQAPWIASAGNAALSSNVAWNGSTPPDVSGIFWEFTIPTNMLQQNVKAGGNTALTTDPINTINGNIALDETDLAVACPAFDLVFARAYNSAATASSSLGRGWTHSLDWSLATASNAAYGSRAGTFKVLATGDGQSYWFCCETNGSFTLAPPQTANLALIFNNGEYRVTWPGGTVARFDTGGAIQRLEDGFGTGLTFTHAAGKLAQVAHDNGKALTLFYSGDLLTRVDSPSTNLCETFAYSADGLLANATRFADGVAYPEQYSYEAVCQVLTQKINAAGQVYAYSVGYVTNTPAWNGNPAVVTARGTGMALEPSGNRWYAHTLNYTNPGNFATRVTYDRGDMNLVHEYAYDPVKMLITGITGPGTPGTTVWSNTWTRFQYDAAQNVTNESVKDGASGDMLEAVAAYDGHHNVLSNGVKYFGNAVQNWSTYNWNTDDTLASATDPAGHKTAFEYTNGLVSLVRECTNGASGFETRFFYTTNGLLSAVTNANGHGLGYENDAAGYVSRVVPALGPDARFVRNDFGQITAVIVPGEAGYRTNALTVNALGQVTAVTHPGGLTESFAFDSLGNLTNMVDTAGRTNVLTWLPTGKPASISRFLQQGTSNQELRTEFAYDRQFNTLKITDPMGRAVESYKLDAQDRPISVTNLEGRVMTVNWSVGDYVNNMTRFDGTTVSNVYHTDGRLLWTRSADVTNIFLWTPDGALRYAQGNLGVVTNCFDLLGRRNIELTMGDRTDAVTWQFDPIGNVTNIAVSNTLVRYGWTYDAAERPLSLTAQAAQNNATVFQWNYNTNNGMVAAVTNAAITESLGYDILDRATNIAWKTAGGTTVRGFGYAFNAAGMITNVAREDGGWTAYTYDSLDRLLSETQYASTGLTYSASWNYDLAGNRTLAVTNGVTNFYSYATGNILTNFGTGTLVQSDLAGNVTNLQYSASRKLSLYWNGRYELTEVKTNGVTAEKYDYDALGRRARIIAGAITNTLVYSGPHVVAEWSNNVLARSYAYGPAVDDVLSMTTYGAVTNTLLYLKDNLGSVVALVNTNGAVVEQYRYTAWGEVTVLSSNGTVLAASAYGNRFTWQGREVSYSTGLLFFRSRYYSASLGRWLSKDKIGIDGGHNLYVAFNNAPTVYVDPFGNCPEEDDSYDWRKDLWDHVDEGGRALRRPLNLLAGVIRDYFHDDSTPHGPAEIRAYEPDTSLLMFMGGIKGKSSRSIRTEWERATGKPWPRDSTTGRNQDVSHIKPKADGGTDALGNIEPKPHDEHMDMHRGNGDFRRWGSRQ